MIAMSNLRNQLRAVLYLASRDAYVKGALVLPVLYAGWFAWVMLASSGYTRADFETAYLGVVGSGAVFGTCFATLGVSSHDLAAHGLRASVTAAGGRTGYVASRVILAGVLAVLLAAWSSLVGLVCLPLPGVTVARGTEPSALALAVVVRVLVGWAFAVIALALTRKPHGMGAVLVASYLVTSGALGYVLEILLTLGSVLLGLDVTSQGIQLLLSPFKLVLLLREPPLGPVHALLLPLACLALAALLLGRRVARESL